MKKTLAIALVLLLSISMLAGCGSGGGNNSGNSENSGSTGNSPANTSSPPASGNPAGETHSAENISALVPDGWKVFPFYSGGEESPNTFSIHKGASSSMDQWYTPGIQIQFYPDGSGFGSNTDKDMYEDVMDLAPLTLGDYTWSGFSGLSKDNSGDYTRPFALLWTDAGNNKIQITVWLEMEDVSITLLDWDVQAIIASIKPK